MEGGMSWVSGKRPRDGHRRGEGPTLAVLKSSTRRQPKIKPGQTTPPPPAPGSPSGARGGLRSVGGDPSAPPSPFQRPPNPRPADGREGATCPPAGINPPPNRSLPQIPSPLGGGGPAVSSRDLRPISRNILIGNGGRTGGGANHPPPLPHTRKQLTPPPSVAPVPCRGTPADPPGLIPPPPPPCPRVCGIEKKCGTKTMGP